MLTKAGQITCTWIRRKCFPEHPREEVWIVQPRGGGFVEGAGWARRPSCSGSHSCEAGHRIPLRVRSHKQRLGQVTPASEAPLRGQHSPAFRTRKSGPRSGTCARKGQQIPRGSWFKGKATWRKAQHIPWGLHFSFLLLCLPPIAHLGVAM